MKELGELLPNLTPPKFDVGEIVLYQNGTKFELGEVKTILVNVSFSITKDEKIINTVEYHYRVWYHTGETTALTNEDLLHKILNLYAFDVKRLPIEEEDNE